MFLSKSKPADDGRITTDFKQREPFSGYRPVDYKDYEPFINLKPVLDGHLSKLFAGELDEGSKNAVDPLIYDAAAKAEQDLELQKTGHTEKIHSICERRAGDKKAFERQLEQLKIALEENERELEDISERYSVNKF